MAADSCLPSWLPVRVGRGMRAVMAVNCHPSHNSKQPASKRRRCGPRSPGPWGHYKSSRTVALVVLAERLCTNQVSLGAPPAFHPIQWHRHRTGWVSRIRSFRGRWPLIATRRINVTVLDV